MWRRYPLVWMFLALAGSICAIGRATAEILTALLPDGVPGYDDGPGVIVTTRQHPDQMPLGLRDGPLIATPKFEASTGYTSNALPGPYRRGSWQIGTGAAIAVASETSTATVGAVLSADDHRVLSLPAQSHTDGSASAGAKIAVGQDTATFAVAHIERHEDRGALNTIPSDRPVAFHLDDVRLAYTISRAPWSLTPELDVTDWRYDPTTIDGLRVGQAYRDRLVIQAGMTLRYGLAPLRDLVLVVRGVRQIYPNTPSGQPDPGSRAFQVLAGMSDQSDPVWHWRLLVGGEVRQFDAAVYQPQTNFIAEGGLSWSPSGMTTVSATLSRETDAAAQQGVSGLTYTAARLSIDHELRRDVLLNGWIGWQQQDDFSGGYQAGTRFGAGVTWAMNRTMRLALTYDQIDLRGSSQVGGVAAAGYSRGLGMMTLRVGM